jgi:hypothetical protein
MCVMASSRVLVNYLHACLNVDNAKTTSLPEYHVNGEGEWCISITLQYSPFEINYYFQKMLKLFPQASLENLSITVTAAAVREKLLADITKAAAIIFNSYPDMKLQCKYLSEDLLALGLVDTQIVDDLLEKFNFIGLYNLENITPQFVSHRHSPGVSSKKIESNKSFIPNLRLPSRSSFSSLDQKFANTPKTIKKTMFEFPIPATRSPGEANLSFIKTTDIESSNTTSSHASLSSHSTPATPKMDLIDPTYHVTEDDFTIHVTPYSPTTITAPEFFLPPTPGKTEGFSMAKINLAHSETDFLEMLRFINRPSLQVLSNYVEALLAKDENITFAMPKGTFTDDNENAATLTFVFSTETHGLAAITGLISVFRKATPLDLTISEDYLTLKISIDLLLRQLKDDFGIAMHFILQKFPDERLAWTHAQDYLYLDNISYTQHKNVMQEFSSWGLSNQHETPSQSNPLWMNSGDAESVIKPQDTAGCRSDIIYLNSSYSSLQLMLKETKFKMECMDANTKKLTRLQIIESQKNASTEDFETQFPTIIPDAPPLLSM